MKHVLVVDDEPVNRELLQALLSGHGFRVSLARHGGEALALATSDPPDLLITDLLMPEMDGYALLQRWRAEPALRDRPAIVYTATYTEPQDEALAYRMGADAFMIKPMDPDVFIERMNAVLSHVHGVDPQGSAEDRETSAGTLRLYNDVLVRKLESKSQELEQQVCALIEAKAQVERLGRRHAVLSAVNQAIVQMSDRQGLLDTVCRVMVTQGGADLAWVGLVDSVSGEIVPTAAAGRAGEWLMRAGTFHVRRPPRFPAEHCIALGEAFVSNDLQNDPAVAPVHALFREAGLHSGGACPLRVGTDIVGSVTVLSSEAGFFDESSAALLRDIGNDLSFALAHAEGEMLRRQTEEDLARLNAELEERIELRTAELRTAIEELNTFSYSVSHDLRAPLAAIDGFTRRVLEDTELKPASAALLQRVVSAASRMETLIADLLALAGVSRREVSRSWCDLSALAAEAIAALRDKEPARDVTVRIAPGLHAEADPGLLRIVLENLLGNAWKFTGKTDRATIEVGRRAGPDGEMAFYVRDNGDGFDMAYARNIFAPFQRLHRANEFEGTGIGLSIVQRAVRKHGGQVGCEAAPGQGATFWFTLGPSQRQAAGR